MSFFSSPHFSLFMRVNAAARAACSPVALMRGVAMPVRAATSSSFCVPAAARAAAGHTFSRRAPVAGASGAGFSTTGEKETTPFFEERRALDAELRQSAEAARAAKEAAEDKQAAHERAVLESTPEGLEPLKVQIPLPGSLENAFAVVYVGGKQWKVIPGDVIYADPMEGAPLGARIVLEKVLLLGGADFTAIGRPMVPDAKVHAIVEEHSRAAKLPVFKKKRRKRYRRLNGARPAYTALRILGIVSEAEQATSRE